MSTSAYENLLVIKQPICKSLVFQSSFFRVLHYYFFFIKTSNNFKIIRSYLDSVYLSRSSSRARAIRTEWHTWIQQLFRAQLRIDPHSVCTEAASGYNEISDVKIVYRHIYFDAIRCSD